jgi:hypothetical protein
VPLREEPQTERTIHIIDRSSGDRVITSIEFLSPGNKTTEEQARRFREKQRELLEGGVNVVEIDLIRQGRWALMAPESVVPPSHAYPYRICVVRGSDPSVAECYEAPLQRRLPAIRVPLRPQDNDAALDLQRLVELAWENGGYEDIDYAREVPPPFSPADAAWINSLLTEKGLTV